MSCLLCTPCWNTKWFCGPSSMLRTPTYSCAAESFCPRNSIHTAEQLQQQEGCCPRGIRADLLQGSPFSEPAEMFHPRGAPTSMWPVASYWRRNDRTGKLTWSWDHRQVWAQKAPWALCLVVSVDRRGEKSRLCREKRRLGQLGFRLLLNFSFWICSGTQGQVSVQ